MNNLCFVLMPFGLKQDSKGRKIDFNKVYYNYIKPAIEKAEITPIRADEEFNNGIIHKPMYERLMLCDFAIADITSVNANVFYELGVRHATKPFSTIVISAFDSNPIFDINMIRICPYQLDSNGELSNINEDMAFLSKKLQEVKENGEEAKDSPIFQLLEDYEVITNLSHEKTDVFKKLAVYNNNIKDQLEKARFIEDGEESLKAIAEIESKIKDPKTVEVGVLVDILLSYRAKSAWKEIIRFYEKLDPVTKKTRLIREQWAFALNRDKQSKEAEVVLQDIIEEFGINPETNGLLGRVYKDLWAENKNENKILSKSYLKRAIQTYLNGYNADIRDAFPGINALTLMCIANPKDENIKPMLEVVKYAVLQEIKKREADYWDYATLLELAIIADNEDDAIDKLTDALPLAAEKWMKETTANNILLFKEARSKNELEVAWLDDIIEALNA